jgi:hypothetical protein
LFLDSEDFEDVGEGHEIPAIYITLDPERGRIAARIFDAIRRMFTYDR